MTKLFGCKEGKECVHRGFGITSSWWNGATHWCGKDKGSCRFRVEVEK